MKVYAGILFFVLLSTAASDYICYKDSASECQMKWFQEQNGVNMTYCRRTTATVQCKLAAAITCNTGFENVARQALSTVVDMCTVGTQSYNAIENGEQCIMATIQDSGECYTELSKDMRNLPGNDDVEENKIICRHVDSIKTCLNQKLE
ncbi:uncharacterized protein [Parasteatoda tepidariorum]|uniref:uncharacterized protein n=1 Tax=Parasteatoda tepidariorum TaxID=114398 RepID=UPI0039BCC595